MLIEGCQQRPKTLDLNRYFIDNLKGELEDKDAKISLAKFLRHNIAFTVDLLAGVKLYPFQEMMINAWFLRNYNMAVLGRGCSKSYTVSSFCYLYPIFNPGAKIVIVSSNFRTARRIFTQIEQFVDSPQAQLLNQCFCDKKTKRNDEFEWLINGGKISALPLAGEGIRGIRADVLILDEFALIPEEIYSKVLMPFLTAGTDLNKKIAIRQREDEMIRKGQMLESQREVFGSDKKIIALSSASYQFEFLYRLYQKWTNKIVGINVEEKAENEIDKTGTHSIFQLSYEAAPLDLIDPTVIEEARTGGTSNAIFLREYCARFTDDSDSFFKASVMQGCTIPDGMMPCVEIKGEADAQYILSIDPSYSGSKASDNFAMEIIKIDRENKAGILVHNYAVAGGDLKDHIAYFYYLITNFNVIYLIIDASGSEFIDAANESSLFKENNIKLDRFDSDFENENYAEALSKAKISYNPAQRKIVHCQHFSSAWIRKANEYLQGCLDNKKVWFASQASATDKINSMKRLTLNYFNHIDDPTKRESEMMEFIEEKDNLIYQTKRECSLIQLSTTPLGAQTFDLPIHLKKSKDPKRARRDSYTCLFMGNWAFKCLTDVEGYNPEEIQATFSPIGIR